MFKNEIEAAANAALAKVSFLKNNPLGYFLMSMMAGAFVGIGVLLAFSIGGQLNGAPAAKTVMGLAFGIALCLVVMAGAELFTGNNMVMSIGVIKKKISAAQAVKLWIVCWLGNYAGGIVLALLYVATGLGNGSAGEFMASVAIGKVTIGVVPMITRGILCNVLVCLAVWCGFRCKEETAKLIMIIYCLFAFITTGFEHCVANMTLFTEVLLNPCGQNTVTLANCAMSMVFVTIGNIIGGAVFIALPYLTAARD